MISKAASSRFDAALIRKSTAAQDEKSQVDNVRSMLAALDVEVAPEHWFICTVPRPDVAANEDFKRLIKLVEQGRVGTIYVESQDRFGTGNNRELFALLDFFIKNGTRLYDCKERMDLTEDDDTVELRVVLGGQRSKGERKNLAYRSLRTRVGNFKRTGSWPNGVQPFGFGKSCYSPDGRLLFVWQPTTSRVIGRTYRPDDNGKLRLSGGLGHVPKREIKECKIVLVPSEIKAQVAAIRQIFDLYAWSGMSRRAITARMNAEGQTIYGQPWTHSLVSQVLTNPAYVGDTHFGKTQSGELHSFDADGGIVSVKRPNRPQQRPASERIIVFHPGLLNNSFAGNPKVFSRQRVGLIFNCHFDSERLLAEAWLNPRRLQEVDTRVLSALSRRQPLEVSTGLVLEEDGVEGVYNGRGYVATASNFRPDHLAILPQGRGACSLRDGCGLAVNSYSVGHATARA